MKGEKGEKGRAAQSFEDLHVYQRARELTNAVYELTRGGEFAAYRGLVDQIRRAATSIMSSIAEGTSSPGITSQGSGSEYAPLRMVPRQ